MKEVSLARKVFDHLLLVVIMIISSLVFGMALIKTLGFHEEVTEIFKFIFGL